jgi:hypothetical protein
MRYPIPAQEILNLRFEFGIWFIVIKVKPKVSVFLKKSETDNYYLNLNLNLCVYKVLKLKGSQSLLTILTFNYKAQLGVDLCWVITWSHGDTNSFSARSRRLTCSIGGLAGAKCAVCCWCAFSMKTTMTLILCLWILAVLRPTGESSWYLINCFSLFLSHSPMGKKILREKTKTLS